MFRAIRGGDRRIGHGEPRRCAGLRSRGVLADLHVVSAYRPPAVVLPRAAEPGFMSSALVEWTPRAGRRPTPPRRVADELAGPVTVTTHAVPAHPATPILAVAEAVDAI